MSSATPSTRSDAGASRDTDSGSRRPLEGAKPPVGTGPAPIFGQLLALLLVVVGVVGVQETLARTGIVQASWTSWVLRSLGALSANFSLLILFVVLTLLGLALLVVVFKPRPRKTLTLSAKTGVYLRTGDLARIAKSVVDGADSVTDVDAAASRSRLRVRVTTVEPPSGNDNIEKDVRERMQPTLDALTSAPRVYVTITNQELT